ncbi:hypothetical protein Naga_100548g4 [Nannochloropsis gaditana]|uniref:Uncharacterized protein n=1 Tax=Nannochloropsis gaditana TaxID=72520 RepID=W7TEE9_9STRA|nr:hypothetical protein Naga_100548g4 [Nannochloropsis gaditana]
MAPASFSPQHTKGRKKRKRDAANSSSYSHTNGRNAIGGVRSITSAHRKRPVCVTRDIFTQLLAPLSPAAFVRDHYDQKIPLVVKGHDFTTLCEQGLESGDIRALLEATPSENISVWTVSGPSQRINTARVQDAGSAMALYEAGHSVRI